MEKRDILIWMNETEKTLVEMVLAGNLEAFDPLVTPYQRALFGLAFRLTRNREDAKEVAQETLLRAFKYLSRYDRERSFKNWLFRILVNAARKTRRKGLPHSQVTELDVATPDVDSHPEERHQRDEMRSQLLECLAPLSRREKEVFLLRDIEDLSIKETAEVMGVSSISVRVHLSAARKKIKEMVLQKYPHLIEGTR